MADELELGLTEPQDRYCYLCKRKEGDLSVGFVTEQGETRVRQVPIELTLYEFDIFRQFQEFMAIPVHGIFKYFLCKECRVLLGHTDVLVREFRGKEEEEKDEEEGIKQ